MMNAKRLCAASPRTMTRWSPASRSTPRRDSAPPVSFRLLSVNSSVPHGALLGRGRHSETEQLLNLVADSGELVARNADRESCDTWLDIASLSSPPSSLAGTWRHYKGGLYTVYAEARGPSGLLVVYTSVDGRVWLRPREMWSEEVEVGDARRERFVRMEDR